MARYTVVKYYSDVSGVEIPGECAGLQFSLDRDSYEIDLSVQEKEALRQSIAPFVAAARPVDLGPAGPQRTSPSLLVGPSARTLRTWAYENGFDVPARGRIPEMIREAYRAAHSDVALPPKTASALRSIKPEEVTEAW